MVCAKVIDLLVESSHPDLRTTNATGRQRVEERKEEEEPKRRERVELTSLQMNLTTSSGSAKRGREKESLGAKPKPINTFTRPNAEV
jgi:hypothetical protein